MFKNFIFFIFIFFIFNEGVFSCKYSGEIAKCNKEVADFTLEKEGKKTYISPGSSIKHIENFVCLQASPEKRLYQISLDKNFQKLDEKMDLYLEKLGNFKSNYFSKSGPDFLDGISDIWEKSDEFEYMYRGICSNEIVDDVKSCLKHSSFLDGLSLKQKEVYSLNEEFSNYTEGSSLDCSNLVDIKIHIFREVAFNTLLLNKQGVLKNSKKEYDIKQRNKYNNLLDLMMVNLSYIERIWQKWPAKLKRTH